MKKALGKKKLLFTLMTMFLVLGSVLYLNNGQIIKGATTAPKDYKSFDELSTPGPGPNIILNGKNTVTGQTVEIPGDYGTFFQLGDKVSYEVTGEIETKYFVDNNNNELSSRIFRFNKDSVNPSVTIKNAAVYNGEYIDVRMVIEDISLAADSAATHNPYFNFIAVEYEDRNFGSGDSTSNPKTLLPVLSSSISKLGDMFLFFGSGDRTTGKNVINDKYNVGDNVKYRYEFIDSSTGQIINFQGIWNYANVNGLKAVSIPQVNDDFSKYYALDGLTVGARLGYMADQPTTGFAEFYGSLTNVNNPNGKFSKLIEAQSITMNIQRRKATTSNSASPMAILYDSSSIARVAPATPIVIGERNSAVHTDTANYLNLKYSILQTIPNNTWDTANNINNRDSSFRLETVVPNYYSFTDENLPNVKIIDYMTHEDLSSIFNVKIDPTNSQKLIIEAKDLTNKTMSDAFNGHVFYISVEASPNENFAFDINAYGYQNTDATDPDNGYMTNFDMAESTTAYYNYLDINGELKSKVDKNNPTEAVSKILYQGIPNADPRENVSFPKGTDVANFTVDQIKQELIQNIRTDTGNDVTPEDLDYIEKIEIVDSFDTSVPGSGIVTVRLTTRQGITKDIPVPVTISETVSSIKVNFVSDAEPADQLKTLTISNLEIGKPYNLSTDQDVINAIAEIEAQGWVLTQSGRPTDEASVMVANDELVREYVFTRAPAKLTVKFVNANDEEITTVSGVESIVIDGKVAQPIDLTDAASGVPSALQALYNAGWNLQETSRPNPENAVVIDVNGTTVTYKFDRATSDILVKFQYEDGTEAKPDVTSLTGFEFGQTINVTAQPEVSSVITELANEGFSVSTVSPSETISVDRDNKTVIYTFKKTEASVKVNFVDDQGNPLVGTPVIIAKSVNDVITNLREEAAVAEVLSKLDVEQNYVIKTPPANETNYTVINGVNEFTYVLEKAKQDLVIQFVDKDGVEVDTTIAPAITIQNVTVDTTVNLRDTAISNVSTILTDLYDAGWNVITRPNNPDDTAVPIVRIAEGETAQVVQYVLEKAKGKLTIKFVDKSSGGPVADALSYERNVNEVIDLSQETEEIPAAIKVELDKLLAAGYQLDSNDAPADNKVTISRTETVITYTFISDSLLTIRFVNENEEEFANTTLTFNKSVGNTINLETDPEIAPQITAKINDILAAGFDLVTSPDPNITMTSGGYTAVYKFTGKLIFVSSPDVIDFGTHAVTSGNMQIKNPTSITGADLAIKDTRAIKSKWTLTAKLDQELKTTGDAVIQDALRYVYQGTEKILKTDAAVEVASDTNTDENLYKVNESWSEDGDGLKIKANSGAIKTSGQYAAKIIWELSDAP